MSLLEIAPGFGFVMLPRSEWFGKELEPLFAKLLIWETPQKQADTRYVVSADTSGGTGNDRAVVDVLRVGTLSRPDEQVAQYVDPWIDPMELAKVIDAIGRFYCSPDGEQALVAVECNGGGIATQGELMRHCGYENFYIWQYEDAANPRARFSQKLGWYTSNASRRMMLQRYYHAITTIDPNTGLPDYLINSPFTIEELRDFQTLPGEPIWMAAAAPGAHDDAIMAGAISVQVAQTIHYDDRESVADTRRRLSEQKARERKLAAGGKRPDFQNTDATVDEMMGRDSEADDDEQYLGEDGLGWTTS